MACNSLLATVGIYNATQKHLMKIPEKQVILSIFVQNPQISSAYTLGCLWTLPLSQLLHKTLNYSLMDQSYHKTDLVKPVALMQQGSHLPCNRLILENRIIKPDAIKIPSLPPFLLCSSQYHLVSLLCSEQYCGPFLKLSFHFLLKNSIDLAASCRNVNQTADTVQRAAVRASGQSTALHKK